MSSSGHTHPTMFSLTVKDITLTSLMTAVTCILGALAIPLPFSPVPLSFTSLALCLMVYVLDFRCSLLCYTIYFLLGAVGLPVFSGFSGGPGHVVGPTGGYLIGFFFQIMISAYVLKHGKGHRLYETAGLILGTAVCHIFGTLWLARQLGLSLTAALTIGVLPYLPGDGTKIAFASIIGPKIRKNLRKAMS